MSPTGEVAVAAANSSRERLVAFVERLAQIASAGGGPAELVAQLAQTSGADVLFEDPQWGPIASAGSGDIPASGRDTIEGRAMGIGIRVESGQRHFGWLCAFGDPALGRAQQAHELKFLLRLTAAAVAADLAQRPDAARGRRAAFWERLLDRAHHDPDAARDDAIASGVALAALYVTVALEPQGAASASRPGGAAELRGVVASAFHGGSADVGILERGTMLLVLVPAVREVDASNVRTAATLLPKTLAKGSTLRVCGGVGTVEPPVTLHRSADAAQTALAIGRRVFGEGRVVCYDELGAYPLLYEGADLRRLQAFAKTVLAPLRAYDDKHQTELEKTLRLFFETGQNVKTAAARLNVHRHTIFYRLRQIAEICARSLESPHDQLTLRLAVAIDALHSA